MEAHGQWVGDSHEATSTIGLHLIFLTADVNDYLTSFRCLNAEVGTTLLVNLGELIAGDGVLYGYSISRYLNLLGNGHICWTLGLKTEMACYGFCVTATQLTIAGSIEVQTVGTIRTVVRRDNLTSMDSLGQFINLLLATDADTLATSLYDVTHVEVHLFGLQLQVTTEVLIDLLHHAGPLGVAGIGLTLMHQDTLDDTILLCLLGQFYQTLVRIVIVSGQHTFHPTWGLLFSILLDTVGQESLDINTTNGYMDDANLDVIRQ